MAPHLVHARLQHACHCGTQHFCICALFACLWLNLTAVCLPDSLASKAHRETYMYIYTYTYAYTEDIHIQIMYMYILLLSCRMHCNAVSYKWLSMHTYTVMWQQTCETRLTWHHIDTVSCDLAEALSPSHGALQSTFVKQRLQTC